MQQSFSPSDQQPPASYGAELCQPGLVHLPQGGYYPTEQVAPQPSELGGWTFPHQPSHGTQASGLAEFGAPPPPVRMRAATTGGRLKRSRGATEEFVSGSVSGLGIQSQLNIPLNGGHPSHGQMARPSVEQQAPGQNWSVPTTAGLPYPPQWQNTPSRASSYAHQRFPSLSTPARPSASHPRPQHSRSHSTANPASVYARSPGSASHPNMFAHHRSASNTSGFNSSPFASPQGRLRTSVSANSLHSQVPYDLQSSSSTDTLDGQTATLNIVDGNPWTSVSPSNAMYAQQSQYLPPSLSPSVSSTYSFAAGQPHTPRSASISSFGGLSSANTSPSGYSTTSLASVQGQRKRPRRKSAQAGTSEGPGPSTRQTYAPQMPAQRPVSLLKRPSPAKTVASAKKPAPKRTSAGPKLATGESVKRPEAVEAVAQLLACGGNPFLRTKGQPRYPFLVGADEVRGANNAMSPDQKYEMLWLCDKFPGVKQEDVAKHYKINRTTMSKSTKEKLRYLATTVAEYEEALVSIAEQRAQDMIVRFAKLEAPLMEWHRSFVRDSGRNPTEDEIKAEGASIMRGVLGWDKKRSHGFAEWLDPFLKRENLEITRSDHASPDPSAHRSGGTLGDAVMSLSEHGLDQLYDDESDEDDEDVDEGMSSVSAVESSLGHVRGWQRSHSGRSTSSVSSSFRGWDEAPGLPAVMEHVAQHVQTRAHTQRQRPRLDSAHSSQGLVTSISDSPASSMDGSGTPNLSLETTPTYQHNEMIQSAIRSATSVATPGRWTQNSDPDLSSFPTTFYPHPFGSADAPDPPTVTADEDSQPGLVWAEWGRKPSPSTIASSGYIDNVFGAEEGLVDLTDLPIDAASMGTFGLNSDEYGLCQLPMDDGGAAGAMEQDALAFAPQPQQQADFHNGAYQSAPPQTSLPFQSYDMSTRSVSSSSASTSTSNSSYPISPHFASDQWNESPLINNYLASPSMDATFVSTDYLFGAPPPPRKGQTTLLPAFNPQQQQQQHVGAKTRSFISSSLSQAFPLAGESGEAGKW